MNRGEDLRRHHRMGVALEMRVRGMGRDGLPFDESTLSSDVSRGGCSFELNLEVDPAAQLELEIYRRSSPRRPPIPFLTTGAVLRVIKLETDDWKVCVQFTGPQFPTYASEVTSSG